MPNHAARLLVSNVSSGGAWAALHVHLAKQFTSCLSCAVLRESALPTMPKAAVATQRLEE